MGRVKRLKRPNFLWSWLPGRKVGLGQSVDAEFTTRLELRSLKALPLAFVGRFKSNAKVMFEAQQIRVNDLARRFLPGEAKWYPKLKRYIKRLEVVFAEVGVVQLLIVWKAQGFGWHLITLISTLTAGI